MNFKPILLGAGAYFVLRALSKKDAVMGFQYTIPGLPSLTYQGGSVVLVVPLEISNERPESFQVSSVYGRAYVDSSFVADFRTENPFVIPANGSVKISVSIIIPLRGAVLALVAALTNGSKKATLEIRGAAVADGLTIPIQVEKQF